MARRDDYGPVQLADRLGLPRWQVETAIRLGLIARPDVKDSRWSEVVAADAAARKAEIAAAVQADAEANRAIGAWRAADHLSTRLHLDVDVDDVVQLAEAGVIEVADYYKNNPLYRVRDLDELAADVVEPVVTKRLQWIQSSTTVQDAAARFGWRVAEFTAAARRRGITAGRDERYALVDVDELAAARPGSGG
jgi:hypothetical protein